MTDSDRETLKDIAYDIIMSNGPRPEYIVVAERLADEWSGFTDMTGAEQDYLLDKLDAIIAAAQIEISWPDDD